MKFVRTDAVLVALDLLFVLALPDYLAVVAIVLMCGAAHGSAVSPLGLLNFLVLQWFGVRLARVYVHDIDGIRVVNPLLDLAMHTSYGVDWHRGRARRGWKFLRWILPLTGWWSDYRWIARRP